jgi:hypothetical protein
MSATSPHRFTPYPSTRMSSCVRCGLPEDNEVHVAEEDRAPLAGLFPAGAPTPPEPLEEFEEVPEGFAPRKHASIARESVINESRQLMVAASDHDWRRFVAWGVKHGCMDVPSAFTALLDEVGA